MDGISAVSFTSLTSDGIGSVNISNECCCCLLGWIKKTELAQRTSRNQLCLRRRGYARVLEDVAEADFTVLVTVTQHCYAEQPTNDSDLFTQQEKQKPAAWMKTV